MSFNPDVETQVEWVENPPENDPAGEPKILFAVGRLDHWTIFGRFQSEPEFRTFREAETEHRRQTANALWFETRGDKSRVEPRRDWVPDVLFSAATPPNYPVAACR